MLALGLATAGPASADLVPLPPLPVDTTCLSTTTVNGILQCTVSTVGGTVTTITSTTQTLIPGTGTSGTSTTTTVPGTSTPYVVSGTTQPRSVRTTTTKTKRHYRKHRGNHRRRR
jgi:hypothetical protein